MQGLEILKASLQSKSVLTDVFVHSSLFVGHETGLGGPAWKALVHPLLIYSQMASTDNGQGLVM